MSAPFRAFHGHIYAVGFSPDADTVAFLPDVPAGVRALPNSEGTLGTVEEDPTKGGAVDIRFQGVDALETHYQPTVSFTKPAGAVEPSGVTQPSAGNHHQRFDLSRGAAQTMLGLLGLTVTSADWHSWGFLTRAVVQGQVVAKKFQDGVKAILVARDVDREGRVLGWVFPAGTALVEGQVLTEAELLAVLKRSINYKLIAAGQAYPYFYWTLGARIRSRLSSAATRAQKAGLGVWALDTSQSGVALPTVAALTEAAVLMPYLFRKALRAWRMQALAAYWGGGDSSPAALAPLRIDGLWISGNPYVYQVSTRDFVRLDELVKVSGDVLTLTVRPQDIVFLD